MLQRLLCPLDIAVPDGVPSNPRETSAFPLHLNPRLILQEALDSVERCKQTARRDREGELCEEFG